jgi:hypothetical protein
MFLLLRELFLVGGLRHPGVENELQHHDRRWHQLLMQSAQVMASALDHPDHPGGWNSGGGQRDVSFG